MKAFITQGYRFLPLLYLISLAASINAQEIRAGSLSISAGGSYNSSESELSDVKNEHLGYSAGLSGNYFFVDNLCLSLNYQQSRSRTEIEFISVDSTYNSQSISISNSIGLGVRKYWFFNKYIAFYVQAGYSYGSGHYEFKSSVINILSPNSIYHEHRLIAAPGIVFFPHPKFAVEMNLGSVRFTANRLKPKSSSPKEIRNDQFSANLAPTLNLGFQYFLIRR